MSTRISCGLILAAAILICAALPLHAQWVTNGAAISTETAPQLYPQITTDGADGAIITWEDWRSISRGIGVARINAFGYVQWTYNIVIGLAAGDSLRPQITSDGLGGAIVTWHDARNGNYDIFAQRLDDTGNPAWSPDVGVGICVLDSAQVDPQIVSDGVGGAIIAWEDERGGYFNVYAQRIDADGDVHAGWTANGIAVSLTNCDQGWIELASDTENGAIITWTDLSGEVPFVGGDIYAQRVLGDGTVGPFSWQSNGTAICDTINDQVYPKIIPDGAGGAIITWSDKRVNNHDDIYAQRIDAGGDIHAGWKLNGEPICVHAERQRTPELTTDGEEGAIITWMDSRDGVDDWDVYVNAINSNGDVTWEPTLSGVCVAGAINEQKIPIITSDGAGGAIIVWRHGLAGFYDLYARRVLHDGSMSTDPIWPAGGVAVCTDTLNQLYAQVISTGVGGAIVTWIDERIRQNEDIYAQRIPPPSCEVTYEFTYTDTLLQEEFFFGCPQGDAYTLKVIVDFDDIETLSFFGPSYTIPASDITIDAVDEPYIFWSEGDIIADGPATAPSYTDTIEHSTASGCGTADVPVRLIGMIVGNANGLSVKSPDFTGNPDWSPDGAVTISDLAEFGFTYFKSLGDPGYNECFDFRPDDIINMSDLTLFAMHYTHRYPFLGSTFPPMKDKSPAGNMILAGGESIGTDPDGTIFVTLSLAAANDITTVALGIDPGLEGLEYRGWTPNPTFPGTPVALTIDLDGRETVFIAALAMEPPGDGEIELGTIEFVLQGERGGYTTLNDGLPYVFAEALDTGGNIRRIHISGSAGHEVPPPLVTRLGDNYPNPFNPTTTIEYSIAREAHVSLAIYNVKGERVRTLVDAFQKRDEYRTVWDGTDAHGNEVASGVYFYRLKTEGFTESKKLILLR